MKQLIRHILREHTREIGEDRGKKRTTDDFISLAKKVHGDKYDYSKVDYTTQRNPVTIICPIHGEFNQIAGVHLKGFGCSKCSGKAKLDNDEFIKRAQKIHGDRYNYSKVNIKGNHNPIKIICPIHGEFNQAPSNHLGGQGCPKCGVEKVTQSLFYDTNKFIELSKKQHGDKYDYSNVEYVDSVTPVSIKCPKHGEFLQKPVYHMGGSGCPSCNESKGEKLVNNILLNNKIKFTRQYKFLDCTNKIKGRYCKKLPFDFYLPDNNTCIEYDGEAHYIVGWGTEDDLLNQQKRDKIKTQYCKKNGIKLIRIPYTMKKEEIEPYILKELGIK